MRTYLFLAIAILAEIVATTALKASEQFTRLWPSVLVVTGYTIAFYSLSQVLKKMNLGIAYAIWSGVGIVVVTAIGVFVYKQKIDLPAIIGIALIVSGVIIINLLSKTAGH